MERRAWKLHLSLVLVVANVSRTISFNLPSHGCYWTESCLSKWIGGCGAGHVIIDQSNDCRGLCPESKYPPCLPLSSHFHCCKPEFPKITDRCAKCKYKIDYGDKDVCCTDCSKPILVDKNSKFGYCATGAELAMQLKPQEVFKWNAGPWMECSSPCDGGVRYRDVGCFGRIEDTSIEHYPVDDSRCSPHGMPSRQEPCNLWSCSDLGNNEVETEKRSEMSAWLITLLLLLGLVAIGGLGFAGYTFYQRRTSSNHGFVYIMLEGYS